MMKILLNLYLKKNDYIVSLTEKNLKTSSQFVLKHTIDLHLKKKNQLHFTFPARSIKHANTFHTVTGNFSGTRLDVSYNQLTRLQASVFLPVLQSMAGSKGFVYLYKSNLHFF